MGRYLGAGLTWTFSTIVFLLLGRAADGWLETDPWLTLLGAFVGAAAGFWSMLRQLRVPDAKKGPIESAGPSERSTKSAEHSTKPLERPDRSDGPE